MENEVIIFEDAKWGKELVPSRFYQAYRIEGPLYSDDEGAWYEFDSKVKSEVVLNPEYSNFETNKWGLAIEKEDLEVVIKANETLSSEYPHAQVKIDSKFYDLNYIKNPVKFHMDKDHRISIIWSSDLVETFRIIKIK